MASCSTSLAPESVNDDDIIKSQPYSFESLYQQQGIDQSWQQLLQTDDLKPLGTHTRHGSLGAEVDINNQLIETGPYANTPIDAVKRDMRLHTLGHPALDSKDFAKWSRWYQEDGNTQIFRLFKDEVNTSNKRKNAARVETFIPSQRWLPQLGVVREFGARFTVLKSGGCVAPHYCSIFQAKGNNVDHWSVMLRVDSDGALWFYPREDLSKRQLISKNAIGRPFDMKVLDDGLNYEMFIDGQSVGTGQWQRTKEIGFRWGIYVGRSAVPEDIIVLVTGASMK
ncbi:hypothetical protein [Catenovulum adriaticum]|uniref:Polysaccharide lyase-like protein n=1 Tax=Catenovulum adriaticum TaxID=2984846 RepID=A0ABY7AQ71_9ALTE|nr:hypothetical protein [Catenovulum sp. TS8]WAJ71699.1 hypothetical protein OLW01_15270 [Catenovulum sp. TS8]